MSRKSSTETLIAAMRVLARDIQSGDGVANAAISEAADRLEGLQSHVMSEHLRDATKMAEQQARIAELEHQAAIGRRAVEVIKDELWAGTCGCISCGYEAPAHAPDCDADAVLREAEQSNMGVG